MASSVCCVVYASQPKLRVQSSLARAMLRGPAAWMLRIWFVPARRSQVTFPSQAGALTRLLGGSACLYLNSRLSLCTK